MDLRRVDPKAISVPEVRVTARFDEEAQAQFQESVKTVGIDEPIKVYEVEGQLVLSDGLHRLAEAIRNKLELVDVYVRPGTMTDVLCNNLMSGHLRGKHPVSEMVRSIEVLWKEYGMDSEKIAARTGLGRDYVEKLQLIAGLTPLCREYLDDGRIKPGHAFALTKIKDPVKQETVLLQQALYNWPVKELEAYIKDLLEIPPPPPPPLTTAPPPGPVTVKCYYCGQEHELREIANPNTCRDCSSTLILSIREALRQLDLEKQAPPPGP